jgi:RNA polymerase sigma-70 factor (ECF subfamily)
MSEVALDVQALRELVNDAQRGNRPAADRLVREHEAWVRSAIFAVTGRWDRVDDIAQQVWTQVWERLSSLKEPERLRPWLYSVARNAALDASQSARRRQAASIEPMADRLDDFRTSEPTTGAIRDELRTTLLRAVEALPAIYREPFVLRHLEDWSYAEIGEMLGLPIETVETRLVRARRLLREMLHGKVDS